MSDEEGESMDAQWVACEEAFVNALPAKECNGHDG